jgi:hypothetical protein
MNQELFNRIEQGFQKWKIQWEQCITTQGIILKWISETRPGNIFIIDKFQEL